MFVYGPHAVGKLTIAAEIARLTGFKLFHNHLTVTPVEALFDEGPVRAEMKQHMRIKLLEAAAREGVRAVFTFAYSGSADDAFVSRVVDAFERHGGPVDFVQLHAPKAELRRRIGADSRRALGKMSQLDRLETSFRERDQFAPVKFARSLRLETGVRSATDNAKLAVAHYRLAQVDAADVTAAEHPTAGTVRIEAL